MSLTLTPGPTLIVKVTEPDSGANPSPSLSSVCVCLCTSGFPCMYHVALLCPPSSSSLSPTVSPVSSHLAPLFPPRWNGSSVPDRNENEHRYFGFGTAPLLSLRMSDGADVSPELGRGSWGGGVGVGWGIACVYVWGGVGGSGIKRATCIVWLFGQCIENEQFSFVM